MKTHELVFEMAFLGFKECKFSHFFEKWQQKLKFIEIILKVHLTKLEMFMKIWTIWVLLLEHYQKNPKIQVSGVSLACEKIEQLHICCSLLFTIWAEDQNLVTKLRYFESFIPQKMKI